MKWRLFALALIIVEVTAIWTVGYATADTSVEVTITGRPVIPGVPGAPTDFQAVYVNNTLVSIDWTNHPNATNVTVIGQPGRYPTAMTDGYVVYYGSEDSVDDTDVDFERYWGGDWCYRAWSQNSSGDWSSDYAQDFVENANVTALVDLIGTVIVPLMAAFGLAVLAFWRRAPLLYLLSGFGFMLFGYGYWETSHAFSILWVLVGIFCLMLMGLDRRNKEA